MDRDYFRSRKPTQAEFEGISLAISGEPDSSEVALSLIAVFPRSDDVGPIAIVSAPSDCRCWVLTMNGNREHWVIRSIGGATLVGDQSEVEIID